MYRFNKSLLVLVGLLILNAAAPAPPVSQGQGPPQFGPRKFYLTRTLHDGAHALSACAAGYHMASLWEILEPSNLRYNTELGFTQDDSGFGPPSGALSSNTVGWIRTGQSANFSTSLGEANCNAWTSGSDVESAAGAGLNSNWISTNVLVVSPWAFIRFSCDSSVRVWCVQN
jgi:hypothetical protein